MPLRSFQSDVTFVRIFDHTKSVDSSTGVVRYRPIDFNPTLVRDEPDVRGRFSAREGGDPSERYSYLYVGEQRVDERTALLECVDILGCGRYSKKDKTRIIDLASLSHLSISYMTLRRAVTLLDVSTEPNASKFMAELRYLQGDNHRITRRWGRYFRHVAPGIDGICYTPKQYGSSEHGVNVVFFAEHGQSGDMFRDDFYQISLASRQGYWRLVELAKHTNLFPVGW